MALIITFPTSLLKVALLLVTALTTYIGFTPPAVPPLPRERLNRAPDFISWTPRLHMAFCAVDKTVLCGIAVAEAVVLLAQWSAPTTLLHQAVGALLYAANVPLDSLFLRLSPASVTACLLAVCGGSVRWWCHLTLGRFFVWKLGTREDHTLVTWGPYRVLRHPSYTGAFLLIAGNLTLLLSSGSFSTESGLRSRWVGKVVATMIVAHLAWTIAGLLYRMRTEDEMMKREFGKSWDEWSQKTPYRIIPFLY